jgi:hypothetical protein
MKSTLVTLVWRCYSHTYEHHNELAIYSINQGNRSGLRRQPHACVRFIKCLEAVGVVYKDGNGNVNNKYPQLSGSLADKERC